MQPDITFLTNDADLTSAREEWQRFALHSPNPHVFSSVIWFDAWRHAFGKNKKLGLLRVRQAGEIIAIQPMMIEAVRRGPALSALYDYAVEDIDFLEQRPRFRFLPIRQLSGLINLEAGNIRSLPLFGNNGMGVSDLAPYLKAMQKISHWDVGRLVCTGSEIQPYLQTLREAGFGAFAKQHFMPLYGLELKPWDDYFASRSRIFRKNFRYTVEQVTKEKKQFIAREYIGRDNVADALEKLFALARRSWKSTGRKGESVVIPLTERAAEFYRYICLTPSSEVVPYVQLLFDGDTVFSGMLALFYKDRLFGCQTYFDPDYARFSPGRLLFREMITHGHAHGARIMDLNGGSQFVKHFSDFSDNYYQILVFNTRPYARLLHVLAKWLSNDLLSAEHAPSTEGNENHDDHGH